MLPVHVGPKRKLIPPEPLQKLRVLVLPRVEGVHSERPLADDSGNAQQRFKYQAVSAA